MGDMKTILLIDDELDLQALVKIALKSRKYNVEIAGNGLEGLEKLKVVKPDLIILDMNMPKMGGLEFYQTICDKQGHAPYPILVLTARANMEELFKQFNIDGFMAKPFEIDQLLQEVDTIIQKRSAGGKKVSAAGGKEPRKICIVEDDEQALGQIGAVFLGAGFIVNPAQNGAEGIERIAATSSDIALVKLGLKDIAGDMVILKLKMMAKTEDVKCILYTQKSPEKTTIAQKIGSKEGIIRFVEYISPKDLLNVVNETLSQA